MTYRYLSVISNGWSSIPGPANPDTLDFAALQQSEKPLLGLFRCKSVWIWNCGSFQISPRLHLTMFLELVGRWNVDHLETTQPPEPGL